MNPWHIALLTFIGYAVGVATPFIYGSIRELVWAYRIARATAQADEAFRARFQERMSDYRGRSHP